MTKRKGSPEQAKRLTDLLKELNISALDFSRKVKYSQPFISLIVNSKQDITHNFSKKVVDAYPSVNVHWLLTGDGPMFLTGDYNAPAQLYRSIPLPANIKKIRDRWDMSQTHFADMLGATKDQVSNWERGRTEPDYESMQQLEVLCGIAQDKIRNVELTNEDIPPRPGTRTVIESQVTLTDIRDRLINIEELLLSLRDQKK
jgi:transcriptional regulator with XRE-family HTH domain